MKWVPLTDDTLQQLKNNGYTHLVVKSITMGEQMQPNKEFVTLEATKGKDEDADKVYSISSDLTDSLVHSSEADYYVLFK